jgi:hypothetical protein
MRVFTCGKCRQTVYFENVRCEKCGMALGFDPQAMTMRTLAPQNDGKQVTTGHQATGRKTYCANYAHNVCNWLVPVTNEGGLCLSCALNRTIPDLSVPSNVEHWFEVEKAKRRLIYTLLKLRLPITQPPGSKLPSLAFDIIAGAKTGHDNGLITINLAEADPATRERTREAFNEPYRTLLGHFRHESGHYYWMVLVNSPSWIEQYRRLFADERADYAAALSIYHQNGPDPDWQKSHISAYATAHSWEDWAETWAHYLHTIDTLETADDYKIEAQAPNAGSVGRPWFASTDPYRARNATQLMDRWVPLALAMNSLNRSMGLPDFYPFVVSSPIIAKLDFIHSLVRSARQ